MPSRSPTATSQGLQKQDAVVEREPKLGTELDTLIWNVGILTANAECLLPIHLFFEQAAGIPSDRHYSR